MLNLEKDLERYVSRDSEDDKTTFWPLLIEEDFVDFLKETHVRIVQQFLISDGSFEEFVKIVVAAYNSYKNAQIHTLD